MIKVFTLNKNGKIELTEKELKQLLDDAYWEGYRENTHTWTYTSPNTWSPYTWTTTTCNGTTGSITLTSTGLGDTNYSTNTPTSNVAVNQ